MSHRLSITGLEVQAAGRTLLQGVDLEAHSGELVAVVGASGAGKSLTGRALVGMVRCEPGVVRGTLCWTRPTGDSIVVPPAPTDARRAALTELRGHGVAWVPQDARAALVPVFTVQRQLQDALRHSGRADAPESCAQLLRSAGFAHPEDLLPQYPHTLSGGMARRVQVAVALALGAPFLVADEPTTGLDRPVQARLMQTLARLRDEGTGIVLITHDLHLVKRHADRVVVMDAGTVVAVGSPMVLRESDHPAVRRLRGDP